MKIVDISQNDDLRTVARKCNTNFRQLAWSIKRDVQAQSRSDMSDVDAALREITNEITEITTVTIPNEVSSQIAAQDIQGKVDTAIADADIPTLVANEVATHIPDAFPPVGSYVMADAAPGYPGTTWQQVDSITTDSSTSIPLWKRTA